MKELKTRSSSQATLSRCSPTSARYRITREVRRPGTYQLLAGEQLRDLVESYAEGFTEIAHRRLTVERLVGVASGQIGETFFVNVIDSYPEDLLLQDLDEVAVPSQVDRLPVVLSSRGQSDAACRLRQQK